MRDDGPQSGTDDNVGDGSPPPGGHAGDGTQPAGNRDTDSARHPDGQAGGRERGPNSQVGGAARNPDGRIGDVARQSDDRDHRGRQSGPTSQESGGSQWLLYAWDLLSSVLIVALIGALLFTASGIWPPMVAVESASMEPTLEKGDLVFVMESDRFPGPNAHETGVVTARAADGTGYTKFGGSGDVIVFMPDGNENATPVIHRSMFWVEEGENWLDKANPAYLKGDSVCKEGSSGDRVPNCPAPNAGFITKGDANPSYDQVSGITDVVQPEWIIGTAEHSVPYLGNIRLRASAAASTNATTD